MQQTPSEQTMDVNTLFSLLTSDPTNTSLISEFLDVYPGLIDARLRNGSTMLLKAIGKKMSDLAAQLIDKRADVNASHNGETPLILAIYLDMFSIADKLLKSGANVSPVDRRKRRAADHLDQITGKSDRESLKALIVKQQILEDRKTRTGSLNPNELLILLNKIPSGKSHMFSTLIRTNKSTLNQFSNAGWTPLTYMIENSSSILTIKKMVKHGADINLLDKNIGHTPLMIAVKKSRVQIIEFLLDLNACDLDAVNSLGRKAEYYIEGAKWPSGETKKQIIDMFAARREKNRIASLTTKPVCSQAVNEPPVATGTCQAKIVTTPTKEQQCTSDLHTIVLNISKGPYTKESLTKCLEGLKYLVYMSNDTTKLELQLIEK